MPKKFHVNTKNTSCDELKKIARKRGFTVKESKKHCKIETLDGKFISVIPRHNPLKRETAKGIIETFNKFGIEISYN